MTRQLHGDGMAMTAYQLDKYAMEYISGKSTLAQIARREGISYSSLGHNSEVGGWSKLKEECRQARLRQPVEEALRDFGNGNGSGRAIVHDLGTAQISYHRAAAALDRLIRRAADDALAAEGADDREQAERRLDRLLERQRIMLRIPGPPKSPPALELKTLGEATSGEVQ